MKIALATCANLPDWEVDDRPFLEHLQKEGFSVATPVWSDSTVEWSGFDLVVVRTTWDYQERQRAFVEWMKTVHKNTRLINPMEVMIWNTEKTYLRDLAEAGAPFLPTRWLERGEAVDLRLEMQALACDKGFIKPTIGASARETLPFDTTEEGLRKGEVHLGRLLGSESLMLQPFLESVMSEGEYSAIFFGGEFSHGVRKVPVPGDYRVQDDFGAKDMPHSFSSADLESVEKIQRALASVVRARCSDGNLAYCRIDLLRDTDGSLKMNEVELVEPSLFFRHELKAPAHFTDVIKKILS